MARMARRSEEWKRQIQQQAASGMTVAKFCALSSLSEASFYYWKRRLQGGVATKQPQRGKPVGLFRKVEVSTPLGSPATVRFPGGSELTFACESRLLREVVAQLLAGPESGREA